MDKELGPARRPWWSWWPVVIGPATMAGVYAARATGCDAWIAKRPHEIIAVCLVASAVLAHGARALKDRSSAHMLLALLAAAFLCREIHWQWTQRGVYLMAGGTFLWGAAWHRRVWRGLRVGRFWPWLCATGWTYILANLVARRVFRGILPHEQSLHVAFEEVLENAAHLMLIITAFADKFGGAAGKTRAEGEPS